MSVVKYYLSESAYAYPSSNADDGGEDNNEYNLRTITDKIAVKSFIIMREGKYEEYFRFDKPGFSTTSTVLRVSGGECCIGGYYCSLGDMELPVTEKSSSGATVKLLSGNTEYNIIVQLFRDSNSNIRGDGTNIKTQKRECRGIALVLATDDELSRLSPSDYLNLGKFTTNSGLLPSISNFTYNIFRYCFLNMKMILTNNNMDIEEWVTHNLRHLNQLSYYIKDTDKEPRATLTLSQNSLGNDTFIYKAGDYTYDISDIEKRTRVAVAKQMTSLRVPQVSSTDIKTYNGESTLICRANHDHDGRYLLRNYESTTSQVIKTPVQFTSSVTVGGTLRVTGATTLSNTLTVNGATTLSSTLGVTGATTLSSTLGVTGATTLSNTLTVNKGASFKSTLEVTGATTLSTLIVNGDTNLNGSTTVGTTASNKNLTVNGDISTTGNLTAGGDVTASKVYNAVWNDYAELYEKSNPLAPSIPGTVICKIPGESTYGPSTKKSKRLVVGVVSDTYGHILGGKSNKSLEDNLQTHYPVAVSGRVSVRVKPGVKVKEGDLLCADDKGYATVKRFFTKGIVIGKALESGQGKVLIQVMMK